MNNKKSIMQLLRKISTIALVVTLILGIISTGVGVGIVAMGKGKAAAEQAAAEQTANGQAQAEEEVYEDPTASRGDATNEISVKDDVIVFTNSQSQEINSAIYSVQKESNGYGENLVLNMHGENVAGLSTVRRGSIVYLRGDKNTPLGESRFMKVESVSSYNGETTLKTSEPYFEEVFSSMDMSTADMLTEENFVDAYYMEGVTSEFGEFDESSLNITQQGVIETPQVGNLNMAVEKPEISDMINQYNTAGDDLIITLDVDLTDLFEKEDDKPEVADPAAPEAPEEEEDDDDDVVESNFSITGQIGIRDLTAYMVCDMPTLGNFEELFIGASGQFFTDVHFNCGVEADFSMDPSQREWKYLTITGLNEKRFPIAVFQFQGLTPVYITNGAFEATKESVIPSLYVIVYADWEGRISLNLSAGFEYAHSFNSGLSVYKKGDFGLSFENYPYTKAYDVEDDGVTWDITLALEAETDITLLGCSIVFYVAGINIGELSVARIGFEARAHVEVSADNKNGVKVCDSSTTEYYIRAYLKMIEVKLKLTLDGEGLLDPLDLDLDFQFSLLDITLFKKGETPNEYIPEVPISSLEAPEDFDSVITIVFDISGSMRDAIDTGETKLRAAQDASKTVLSTTKAFAERYPDEKYGIGIVKFGSHGETVSVPHIDYKYLDDCVETLETNGSTNLYSGVEIAVSQLNSVESPNKIIILMTDGNADGGSAEDVAGLVAGKEIKIYTVGFGRDVNEEYLRTIASLTGGEYRFADTSNMMGIIGSFLYAQQASTSEVVAEFEDSVAEGETTKPKDFVVQDKNGDLRVTTAWPGSFLDTILIDPTGRVVDENYPGTTIDESQIPSIITVENPIHGTWSVQVKGVETSYEKEPFYTIVSFKETEPVKVNETMNTWENVAAYCIPIGVYVTFVSSMLLVCVGRKKSDDDE